MNQECRTRSGNKTNKIALTIGIVCIGAYLTNYYLRHILSVLTPKLLEVEGFTVEHIALLSSIYMFFYASGQLVNGFIGDYISPRKLASLGIFVAGTVSIVFPLLCNRFLQMVLWAFFGFALSMVRGPFMKIISENTSSNRARKICMFFSFASFAGPLIASLFAMIGNWKWAFIIAGAVSVLASVITYTALTTMERKGQISYKVNKGQGIKSIFEVFKIDKFVFYMIISAIVEMGGTSISFWIPTFLTDKLLLAKETANLLFTLMYIACSLMPFVTLLIFRLMKERDILLLRITFLMSAFFFVMMLFSHNLWVSLLLLFLARMSLSCSSALLWSIYIPGLGKTGRVSSVNGVLDCTGYIFAAVANLLFAGAMSSVGWNTVILLWSGIGAIGLIATFTVNAFGARSVK